MSIDKAPITKDDELNILINADMETKTAAYIRRFFVELPGFQKEEEKLETLRKKFVSDYTVKRIMSLSKEEYVVGFGTNDTFCYRLEDELKDLGDIHGAFATKFGLYYGSIGNDNEKKYRVFGNKFGSDPDAALSTIKEEIVNLIAAGQNKDYEKIRECKLWPMYRGKILATYFPNQYLGIFTNKHLDYFLMSIGIFLQGEVDVIDKQLALLDWKEQQPELKGLSNYLFVRFLYYSFDKPLKAAANEKESQRQKDKDYPQEYVSKTKITVKQWRQLIVDKNVFNNKDIDLICRIYREDNHAASCYDLAAQEGVEPQTLITPIVLLARRVADTLKLSPVQIEDGRKVWWRILFWGKYREDGHFEWKLQPNLAEAISELFSNLDIELINSEEDERLVTELKQSTIIKTIEGFQYNGKPQPKAVPIYIGGHKTYPRDRKKAVNALSHAYFKCEIEKDHPTFLRRNSNKPYTEPHHLIPMSYSDQFSVTLDIEENIVSLCSNCHNEIHYGKNAALLIKKLFQERRDALLSVGIKVTLDELLKMYGLQLER